MRLVDHFKQKLEEDLSSRLQHYDEMEAQTNLRIANQLGVKKRQLRITCMLSHAALNRLQHIYNEYQEDMSSAKEAEQIFQQEKAQWHELARLKLQRTYKDLEQEIRCYMGNRASTEALSDEASEASTYHSIILEWLDNQFQLYADKVIVETWDMLKVNYEQLKTICQAKNREYDQICEKSFQHVDKMSENQDQVHTALKASFDRIRRHSLVRYCADGNFSAIKRHFNKMKPELNTQLYGVYPLHVACQQGYTDIARWLHKKGAQADLRDAFDKTAFDYLSENDCSEDELTRNKFIYNMRNALKILFSLGQLSSKPQCTEQATASDNDNTTQMHNPSSVKSRSPSDDGDISLPDLNNIEVSSCDSESSDSMATTDPGYSLARSRSRSVDLGETMRGDITLQINNRISTPTF